MLWLLAAVILPAVPIAFWKTGRGNAAAIRATLYKDPQCSCCERYASYLREHDFDVRVLPINDLASLNRQHGMPEALDGCHTTLMAGYVVVGHVPIEVIQRLMTEKPDVIGISLPGMPSGTPGMGGPKEGPFTIYGIGKKGQFVFATV